MLDGIRERYPLAKPDGEGIRLVLGLGEVRVGLRLRCVESAAGRALVTCAFIGPRTAMDPQAALATNAHLVHGALTVIGGDLMLRSVLVERQARIAPEDHLQAVAAEAARIKIALRRVPGDHDVFDAYRE